MDERQVDWVREVETGAAAYMRNLAAAEAAVLRGQFNVAKVLRSVAYAQRTLALNAARRIEKTASPNPTVLLNTILRELQSANLAPTPSPQAPLSQLAVVRERLTALIERALASLALHPDILESDVALDIHVCLNCGNAVEGSMPKICDLCGTIQAEFIWFGPFYGSTPEHLGQLTPQTAVSILQQGPTRVAELILSQDDALLRRKPSPEEWSVKEIVAHILETDRWFVMEVRAVLDGTPIEHALPPWKTHEGKGYQDYSAQELVQLFTEERQKTLDLLDTLAPEDWSRQGIAYNQSFTILDNGTWHGNHDRGHIAQIERLLRQWDALPSAAT